ncbi:helicase-related protein [Halorussus sp. MSC15.2]|uniref:helicase-related protein n=1 Tax=Halorussus sp. MSC15.2 TaxID=2283638 RepID=UPI0013D2E26F|nr:helicase-related protein [Halorussus sp. MSC15.2]NEU58728.1 DEAD/DEAH box helicase family protein [Halorussus sp. MSC15.2]
MLHLEPLVDNTETNLADTYRKVIRESEEARIATGYFYVSGFDLVKDDLDLLADPEELGRSPVRILMGRSTDRHTADEVEEGLSLREQLEDQIKEDIEELNNAQVERLDRLRDFIANGLIEIRVRNPESGYFHAKGASFRSPPESPEIREGENDQRGGAVVVGSSNFSKTGHTKNIELNLTSQEPQDIGAFDDWFDNQWANADEFNEDLLDIIESHDKYQDWKGKQGGSDDELGQYLEPFELYKLLAYDALNGNVGTRDSPLFYFQKLGYESAKEKLAQYNGCIISDSVGLGKSFIGSELLYDYRQRAKNCLLIVPANLVDQWADLLQDATNEDGDPHFGLEVDGTHLDVMSISKFQNLSYDDVQELRDTFDVILVDEAHRFRNFGKWRPQPDDEDDYKGTRRHANLRQLRGKTMIMLTATPINNSATDLKNLISLFTGENQLRNNASLNFGAFDDYIELAEERKRVIAHKEEVSEEERERLTDQLTRKSEVISDILNEVMVLRTRKHVKEQLQDDEELEMSFSPPTLHKEEYSLPLAYQPVYRVLPDVMDALHLPHITVKNPQAGGTLKALYKLNLLKRLESSTYAFVQSIQTLHQSEVTLLNFLEDLPEDEEIDVLRQYNEEDSSSLDDFVEGEDAEELAQTLEEFGFDSTMVRADQEESDQNELADATVGEVRTYIREDLTLLAHFLTKFIGDVARHSGPVNDAAVKLRTWLEDNRVDRVPDVPEEEQNPDLYPHADLDDVRDATDEFYAEVFALHEFRDPKVDQVGDVLQSHNKKVLIFTQYRATADYVYETLVDDPDSPMTRANSAVVKGGDDNKQAVIERFAPEASGYQRTLEETGESELQYVVATDTLSEGVNLQDVHVVVNYDLPWNPMRIVQRVGRVDRIGSTAEKHVHNFYPDGDIEAAIKLLKRLQAKINDIALIVGKENNILDPNEDQILERAGVETEKTIGELEVEEIEASLEQSRAVDDYNELDDTSKNPLLRNAGSNEEQAFERFLLKEDLNDEYGLDEEDFEFAEDFFEESPPEREFLYTNVTDGSGPRPGVFALAHMWFEDDDDAPLGRVRRGFYYKPFSDDVKERGVRTLKIEPDAEGEPMSGDLTRVLESREAISELVDQRLENVRSSQVEGTFEQGKEYSKEQETLISYLQHLQGSASEGEVSQSNEFDTVGEWASELESRLRDVKLENTDEDRILRETFRHHDEYDAIGSWPVEELLSELEIFLDDNIAGSTEYQETLVRESEIHAELMCWGVVAGQ